jgi:colanic acid/amylovoran biosynthesis glycosyltransferase
MAAGPRRTLLLIPTLPAVLTPGGGIVLTKKFVEGCAAFKACWNGPLELLMRPIPRPTDNLDNQEYGPGELPFRVHVLDYADPAVKQHMAAAAVILGGLCHEQSHLADWAREVGTPFAYTSEYSLKTRLQIASVEEKNVLKRLRRQHFERRLEQRHLRSLRIASGLQCNGTPTYDSYRGVARSPMLFFDTRLDEAHLITPQALEERLLERERRRLAGMPIRLAFSGRLKEMKGVDHLVPVAAELRRLGVPFELDIFGDGNLTRQIDAGIQKLGLGAQVRRHGTVDFHAELMPRIQSSCDLFVACHRQGDPSCTYLETFGCGVPIAGYGNEAFSGLLEHTPAGNAVPMDQPEALARTIQALAENTENLARLSRTARAFASQNTCERTFSLRTEHLRGLAAEAR